MASYTRDELALIRHYYQFYGPHWVMWRLLLPGRTPKQIASKASEMGVKCDPQVVLMQRRDGDSAARPASQPAAPAAATPPSAPVYDDDLPF